METNLSYLENMADGDPVLISEMIEIFSTQVREFGALMYTYLEQENWQELSRLAHKAKSSVAIMGMTDLAKKLKKLEKLAREEKLVDTYPAYIENFNTACNEAVSELHSYISKD